MSILIKGMEMPTTCCHCKLMVYNHELVWDDAGTERTGAWVCLLTGELIDNTKREEHCPLIPVPPHGRLIEKNAVFELIRSFPNVDRQLSVEFMKALYELPTILEAEEGET